MPACALVHGHVPAGSDTAAMTASIATDPRRQAGFIHADPSRARTLRPAQVEEFNRDGIIGPVTVHTPAEVRRNRNDFEAV